MALVLEEITTGFCGKMNLFFENGVSQQPSQRIGYFLIRVGGQIEIHLKSPKIGAGIHLFDPINVFQPDQPCARSLGGGNPFLLSHIVG